MRKPVPLLIPPHLIAESRLYAPGRPDTDAVIHLLEDYPRLVSELRRLRNRVLQLDNEALLFDARIEALQEACRAILDL